MPGCTFSRSQVALSEYGLLVPKMTFSILKPYVHVVQVPLFLRKTVKSYTAVPDRAPHAYTVAGQITLFGKTSENVFIHESAHAYDGKFKLSGQQAYLQALSADSCVPDEYAQNNNVECFAQDMVVLLYYLWKPNPSRKSCLSQQIGFVSNLDTPGFQSYKDSVGKAHWPTVFHMSCTLWNADHMPCCCLQAVAPYECLQADIIMQTREAKGSY